MQKKNYLVINKIFIDILIEEFKSSSSNPVLEDIKKEKEKFRFQSENLSLEHRTFQYVLNSKGSYPYMLLSGKYIAFDYNFKNIKEDSSLFRLLKIIPSFNLNKIIYLNILISFLFYDDLSNHLGRDYRRGIAGELFSLIPNGDNWSKGVIVSLENKNNLKKWLSENLLLENLFLDPIVIDYCFKKEEKPGVIKEFFYSILMLINFTKELV
ncbi:MAG: hypothetical protein WCO35_02670 [Candidatus Nomurabacteria bacterium]